MYNLQAKLVEPHRRAVYSKALPAECRETTPFLDSPDSTDRMYKDPFIREKTYLTRMFPMSPISIFVKLQSKVQTSVLGLGVDFVLPLSQQQEEEQEGGEDEPLPAF